MEDTIYMKEKRYVYIALASFLGLLSILIVVGIIGGIIGVSALDNAAKGENVIRVTGESEVFAVPDIAMLTFSVVAERDTPEAAQEESAEKINAITDFLDDAGVDEKDIKTSYYNLNPRYEYKRSGLCNGYPCPPSGERVLTGYEVNQTIQVKVRDTEDVGEILAGIGGLGATNIYGPNFQIDEPDELQEQAVREAISDAKEKAKKRAGALGVRLGDVLNVQEGGGYGYPIAFETRGLSIAEDKAVGGSIAPEVPVGENIIRSSVTITFEIK
tara:strand:+ start:1561 stop:2376 length:816 start_codon:yes stop_codon:yes gene_type:complete